MMQPRLALKVDVDTWRGTCEGVPRLTELLARHGINATFLFSLGPDHTGRALRRLFRKGFLRKVSRTSVLTHYGLRTLLYGTLLPGPDIGVRAAPIMRAVRDQGFEVGIHAWDHIKWQDNVAMQNAVWTRKEMECAVQRFQDIFGEPARCHGAAGWQMNEAALSLEKELGFEYASDGRGTHPFFPVNALGEKIGVPQLPTTLPTLDELIGVGGLSLDNVDQYLINLTRLPPPSGHVYTLHAELEGGRFLPTFERLLLAWREQGYQLCSCRDLFATLTREALPLHRMLSGEVAGRSGQLSIQGPAASN